MKTKHLFSAMMLSALFAACSNEEWETMGNKPSDLSDRPVAGNVQFNFTKGADTRLDADFNWVNGDRIGACLMDEYTPGTGAAEQNAPWMANYTFVDYNHTNYRYNYNDGQWVNGDLLSSGNYFFYYPYDANLNNRISFEKIMNANQELTGFSTEELRQVINDNQMYLGYNYVTGATEGDTQPLNIEMKSVFAFPAFTITNVGTTPRTILKIALQKTDGSNNDVDWNLVARVNPAQSITTPATTFMEDPTAAVEWDNKSELYENIATTAKQIQVRMPENTVLRQNESLNTYIVVPAGEYAASTTNPEKVTMLIYTTTGIVNVDLSDREESGSADATNSAVFENIYPDRREETGGQYYRCNVEFDDPAVVMPSANTVSSTEDLDMYIAMFEGEYMTGDLTITTIGNGVELSKASYDILNANRTLRTKFIGNLTIGEGVGENVLDLITIDNTNASTLTNKSTINVPATLGSNVKLVNKGTINLAGASYTNDFQNDGTMNIASAQPNGTVSFTLSANNTDFVNNGVVNINSNMTLTSNHGIGNNGSINILRGTTNGKIENLFTAANRTYVAGTVTVAQGATWELKGKDAYNKGTIVNNGTIEVPSSEVYYNDVAQNYTNAAGQPAQFMPTVENNGVLAGITNNGLVVQGANATYSTSNITTARGRVDNTNVSTRTTASAGETIFVKVAEAADAAELNAKLQDAQAELVQFNNAGSLTLDAADIEEGETTFQLLIPTVEIYGNLTITTPAGKILNIVNANGGTWLNVMTGTTTISARSQVNLGGGSYGAFINLESNTLLEVSNNAMLSSEVNIQFRGAGYVGNYGAITNVLSGHEPNLTTGSNNVVTK